MLVIAPGSKIFVNGVNSGENEKGTWKYVNTMDSRHKNKTNVFLTDPDMDVKTGDVLKVKTVDQVKYGLKKTPDGKWIPNATTQVDAELTDEKFEDDTGIDDDAGLPF